MICCVPVGQAEVLVASGTDAGYQLLLLTLRLVALVAKHLVFLLLLTVLLDVSRHSQVWNSSTGNWNWRVAKGANRHLNIFLIQAFTLVIIVLKMVLAEELAAGIALHGEVVQLLAEGVTAVLAHVRKFHFDV